VLPSLLAPTPPHLDPVPTAQPLEAQHRFALSKEDANLEKETPALVVDAQNRTLLAWASQTDTQEYTLFLARSDDLGTTFTKPIAFRKVPIHRHKMPSKSKDGTTKEREMTTPLLPRLTAHGDVITLGWLEPDQDLTRVRFLKAESRDGGVTFGEPVCVHGDTAKRPGYTSLSAGADGSLVQLWLDSRGGSPLPYCRVGDSEVMVYPGAEGKGVCPCCDLDVIRAADGSTFAAFRNSKDGHRDMYVARSAPGSTLSFEPAVCVTETHWKFDGCPHDGPALAINRDRLHIMWMDVVNEKRRVHLATSPLDKLSFEERQLELDIAVEQGHPQLTATAGGVLHIVWDQTLPGTSAKGTSKAIVYTSSNDNGKTFSKPGTLAVVEGAFQTRPVIVATATGTILTAWSEVGEAGKSVVVGRLSPTASACCERCGCGSPSRGAVLHAQ
jgi:hypothetical protein